MRFTNDILKFTCQHALIVTRQIANKPYVLNPLLFDSPAFVVIRLLKKSTHRVNTTELEQFAPAGVLEGLGTEAQLHPYVEHCIRVAIEITSSALPQRTIFRDF